MISNKSFDRLSIQQVLQKKKHRHLIKISERSTVQEFLAILAKEGIKSAPIYRINDATGTKILKGILSLSNVLNYGLSHNLLPISANEFEDALNHYDFLQTQLTTIMQEGVDPKPVILLSSDSLATLSNLFNNGYHRALVLEPDLFLDTSDGVTVHVQSKVKLVSQTDVINFIYQEFETSSSISCPWVDNILATKVCTIAPKGNRVIGLSQDQPVIEAFKLMKENNIHAVPILDGQQHIVCDISESDIKGLDMETLNRLGQPLRDYLKAPKNVKIGFDAHVSDAIAQMIESKVHHLWLVDDDNHAAGVVTMTDIISLFE